MPVVVVVEGDVAVVVVNAVVSLKLLLLLQLSIFLL